MHNPLSTLFLMFNQVLARDGYRCMITKLIDESSLDHCADLQVIQERDRIDAVTVETAHILNESTVQSTDPAGTSEDTAQENKVRFRHVEYSNILTRYPDTICRWCYGHIGVLWIDKICRGFRTTGRCSRALESAFLRAQSPPKI